MFLPARYRSFHVVGIPLARDYAITRGDGADTWRGRLTLGDVSMHAAGAGERLTWPEGVSCLYINLRPALLERGTTTETHHRLRDRTVREIGMALLDLVAAPNGDERSATRLVGELVDHLARRRSSSGALGSRLGRRALSDVVEQLRAGTAGSMTDLAASCGLTRAHFTRRFRTLTGDSPYAVMLGSRVEHAKYLLTARRRSISEVAYATGFTDQSHLSHTFQRLVGATPAQFRELHHRTAEQLTSTNLQDRR